MQYGADIFPYQRSKRMEKQKEKREVNFNLIFKVTVFFVSSFLMSRVMFINFIAPFGIAFLLSIASQKNCEKILIISSIGSLLGYISLHNNIKNLSIYLIIVLTIPLARCVFKNTKNKKSIIIMYTLIYVELLLYKVIFLKFSVPMGILETSFNIGCLFPIYFIINYSILSFKDINTMHLFENEEIISMAITLSLVVSGTWGVNIAGISIRNLIALTLVVIIGYIKGSTSSAAVGVAMGTIVGLGSKDMIMFISVYGLCGLISGAFKEAGKWFTGIAYIISFIILKLYSNLNYQFKIEEAVIALVIFYLIPNKIYKKMEIELDYEKKQENIQDDYINKIKNLVIKRLENFSDVLYSMSDILEKLVDNNKLAMKNKSGALIENLADRVCSNCTMNNICWKRENYYTYNALGELIQNYQGNKKEVPYEIERKCIKRGQLIKNTEELANNFIINEMWKKRLSEYRGVLASGVNNMAESIGEIREEFNSSIKFSNIMDKNIRRILNKNNIKYKDLFCYNNEKGRLIVKLSMNACGGKQKCVKEILPLLNKVTGKIMCISDDGCNMNVEEGTCNVVFEETPKYHIATYVSKLCKDGEQCNGDSYTFGKLKDGSYITIISDGMGSGPQAGQESKVVVELIERFVQSGFSKITAINTINSIMNIKFTESEKFSTVDLASVDLYNGKMDFMKIGAVASFIKRGKDIDVISSKTLPIGILDKVDIDVEEKEVKNGDILLMVSDGVLDYETNEAGKVDWVVNYLKNIETNNPKDICEGIMETAKKLSKGKIKDDMTVIAQKVYSLY